MKMLEKYFVLTRKIFAFPSLQHRSAFGKSLMVHICWYHKMKQLTCIFICAMLMKILKDKERVFSKQLFWITPFGVKAIRTAGSTAADGNFGCLID